MHRLDDETTHLVGQVEQDLRHRVKRRGPSDGVVDYEDLEDRLRECFESALARL